MVVPKGSTSLELPEYNVGCCPVCSSGCCWFDGIWFDFTTAGITTVDTPFVMCPTLVDVNGTPAATGIVGLIETVGDNNIEGTLVTVAVAVVLLTIMVDFGAIGRYIFKPAAGVAEARCFRSLIVPEEPVGINTVVLTIGKVAMGFGVTIVDG